MRTITEQVVNWCNQCGKENVYVLICMVQNKVEKVIEKKILVANNPSEAMLEAQKICNVHNWRLLGLLKAQEFLRLSNVVGWSVGWEEALQWKEGKTTLYYHNCPHCKHKAFSVDRPRRVCTKCHRSLRGNYKVLNWKDLND